MNVREIDSLQVSSTYPIIAVVGLTASGKTDFSLDLAEYLSDYAAKIGCQSFEPEIVCADAFQLYRGMDIGTAKVTPEERRGIPHHQLDVLEINEVASVAVYQEKARRDIAEIYQRGHTPIVVGGSGLYVRALLDVISFPGTKPELRSELYEQLKTKGQTRMHQWLAEVDPVSAERLEPADTRRVIRALEVTLGFGTPFSATLPQEQYYQPTLQFALKQPMELLDERIARRSQLMFEGGFLDEVQALVERGLMATPTACRATGYAAAARHLAGEISREQALEELGLETRRLARKQRKWFRRDSRIHWIAADLPRPQQFAEVTPLLSPLFER